MEVVCEYDNSVEQKFCNIGRHLGLGGEGYSLRFSWSDRNRNQMGINCTIFSSVKRTYISSEVSINLDIQNHHILSRSSLTINSSRNQPKQIKSLQSIPTPFSTPHNQQKK